MIGHFAKDQLIVDGHAETASGGGVYYGSIALRYLGIRVAVVTRLHPDDFPRLDEMRQAGAPGGAPGGVEVFATPASETSGIANYYNSQDMERRTCKPLGFAGPFIRADIAAALESLGAPRAIIIASIIAGEVPLPLLKWLSTKAIAPPPHQGASVGDLAQRRGIGRRLHPTGGGIGLDVQGFIRVREGDDLVFRPWETMAEALSYVTYLKADRAEAKSLTGETRLQKAARKLASYGPQEIVLTQSSGVTVYDAVRDAFHTAPFTSRTLAGRTGRGDTCFATYIGQRLTLSPAEATRWAAAVTTLKQEKPGPWRGSKATVKAMLEK